MNYILSLSLLFVLLGCASSEYSSGTYLDREMVNKIVQDKTTILEVENIFGKPFSINMDGNNLTYNYFYTVSKTDAQSYIFKVDYKMEGFQRMLTIIFNENKVVTKYNFSETPLNMKSN